MMALSFASDFDIGALDVRRAMEKRAHAAEREGFRALT
jgi:hypothetical protein